MNFYEYFRRPSSKYIKERGDSKQKKNVAKKKFSTNIQIEVENEKGKYHICDTHARSKINNT
jgi:hypothetical protein